LRNWIISLESIITGHPADHDQRLNTEVGFQPLAKPEK